LYVACASAAGALQHESPPLSCPEEDYITSGEKNQYNVSNPFPKGVPPKAAGVCCWWIALRSQ
ncbi:MAG: hypothetical protein LBE15_01740, partial [Burkholderiales bacterium]|nr:hypothetical protein [Burkholderiales bacterium]